MTATKQDIHPAVSVLRLIGVLVASVVLIFINGWLLSLAWRWFAIPLGAPVIGFWPLVGAAIVLRLARPVEHMQWKNHDADLGQMYVSALVVSPLLTLATMAFVRAMLP